MRSRLLPLAALGLFAVAVGLTILTAGTSDESGISRSASIYDEGPGGVSVLRRYLEANGVRTTSLQSDRFAVPEDVDAVFVLGATDEIAPADLAALREHVRRGGTLVVASDLALTERSLLAAFGIRRAGTTVRPGEHEVASIALAAPLVRRITVDVGIAFDPGTSGEIIASDGRSAFVVSSREGAGRIFAVGTLAPFLNGTIGSADNARLALALAGAALPGRIVAFDEFHHGVRAAPDALGVLTGSWSGRALLLAGAFGLAFLAVTGRRLGPPLPLDPRPPRSSLEYVRGFAGLVRRSGHREIPRRRAREELRLGLARQAGLDPATPFDEVVRIVARRDPARAARAVALDDAILRGPRDDQLLRIVAQVRDILETGS
ncbi:MAG TPA: DUF4350 domain-containing protein [Candidatus Limnocylindria bacterium]|nr:DUF4350 domain-containing protein [Candidatus Limnocylindria bacterium]